VGFQSDRAAFNKSSVLQLLDLQSCQRYRDKLKLVQVFQVFLHMTLSWRSRSFVCCDDCTFFLNKSFRTSKHCIRIGFSCEFDGSKNNQYFYLFQTLLDWTSENIDLHVNPLISVLYCSVKDFQLAAVFNQQDGRRIFYNPGFNSLCFVWTNQTTDIHGWWTQEFSIAHGGRPRCEFDTVVRVRYQPQWLSAMHMDMTRLSVWYSYTLCVACTARGYFWSSQKREAIFWSTCCYILFQFLLICCVDIAPITYWRFRSICLISLADV
jgi:hypothetical protein